MIEEEGFNEVVQRSIIKAYTFDTRGPSRGRSAEILMIKQQAFFGAMKPLRER